MVTGPRGPGIHDEECDLDDDCTCGAAPMRWRLSWKADPRALPLADRHYNRQKVGAPQFAPPARHVLVLLTEPADALWISAWPDAEYVRHAWAGAWVCTLFRNESPHLSSDLIVEAVAATRHAWGDPPELGMVTFVDETKVRRKRDPGRCFLRAGFEVVGRTVDRNLVALQLVPERMPAPAPARPRFGELELGAPA